MPNHDDAADYAGLPPIVPEEPPDRDLVTGHGEEYDRLVNMPRALSEAEIQRMLGIARETL